MGTIPKTEGATMTCLECSTKLECHMSNYKGDFQNKLQWQNPDGSAHYKWSGTNEDDTPKFKCVLPETKAPETAPTQQETDSNQKHLQEKQEEIKNKPDIPKLEDDRQAKVIQETELLNSIDTLVMATLKQYDAAPSPQKVGMFTKIIYDTYFAPKFEKAIHR